MGAVAEAAVLGEGLDVVEAGFEVLDGLVGVGPELHFAQAGQVHEKPVVGHAEELAGGGGVAAAAVGIANGAGGLALVAEQAVENGGLADAAGADEGRGLIGRELPGQRVQIFVGLGADGQYGDGRAERLDGGYDFGQVEIERGGEVGLVEQDDGACAAFVGHNQETFNATRVIVAVEAADDEQDVDVGGEDLFADLAFGLLAGDAGLADEDVIDDRFVGAEQDPVADGRPEDAGLAQESADTGVDFSGRLGVGRGPDREAAMVCGGDAAGNTGWRTGSWARLES